MPKIATSVRCQRSTISLLYCELLAEVILELLRIKKMGMYRDRLDVGRVYNPPTRQRNDFHCGDSPVTFQSGQRRELPSAEAVKRTRRATRAFRKTTPTCPAPALLSFSLTPPVFWYGSSAIRP